jgi:hypothetical protein
LSRLQALTGGWHSCKPGQYSFEGDQSGILTSRPLIGTKDIIHFSVNTLLEKRLAHNCIGLKSLQRDENYLGYYWEKAPDPSFRLEEEEQSYLEKYILATWTARKLLKTVQRVDKSIPHQYRSAVDVNIVPTYAVIYEPRVWILKKEGKVDLMESSLTLETVANGRSGTIYTIRRRRF